MAAYSSALHNVALAGPTLFGQVINKAAQIAGQSHLIQQQQVLCFAHYYGKENFNFFFFFSRGNDIRFYLLKFTLYNEKEKKWHVLTKQRPTHFLLQH